jgi:hypothetical protein
MHKEVVLKYMAIVILTTFLLSSCTGVDSGQGAERRTDTPEVEVAGTPPAPIDEVIREIEYDSADQIEMHEMLLEAIKNEEIVSAKTAKIGFQTPMFRVLAILEVDGITVLHNGSTYKTWANVGSSGIKMQLCNEANTGFDSIEECRISGYSIEGTEQTAGQPRLLDQIWIGQLKREVIRILGEPEDGSAEMSTWNIDGDSIGGVKSYRLEVTFNSAELVSSAKLYEA